MRHGFGGVRTARPLLRRAAAAAGLALVAASTTALPAEVAQAVAPPAGQFAVQVAPDHLAPGATTTLAFTVTDFGTAKLGSIRIAVASGYSVARLGTAVTGGTTWNLTQASCTAKVKPCTGNGSYVEADPPPTGLNLQLLPGSTLVITLDAVAPRTPGSATWQVAASNSRGLGGSALVLTGSAPMTTVVAPAPVSLQLSGLPANPVTAGTPFSVTVTATDADGHAVTGYTGTVHFSLTPPGSAATRSGTTGTALPPDYTYTGGDAGQHTFSLTLTSAPSQGFYVWDTATTSLAGSGVVPIVPAAASSLVLTGPSAATAGSGFSTTLTAYDPYGNAATGYTGTVTFTSDDNGSATSLPAAYTFVPSDAGTRAFPVTLSTAGARTVSVGDGSLGAQLAVQVGPAAAQTLHVVAPASGVTAGTPFSVAVSVVDPFGNVVPSFTGTVHLATGSAGATLPPDYTFTPADAGSHVFDSAVTLLVAGSPTLTATDAADGLSGSTSVDVAPGAPDHLTVQAPASTTAGSAVAVTFTVRDAFGNQVTAYNGPAAVSCTGTGSQGSCPAGGTFAGGQLLVSPTLTTAGAGSVTASTGALAPVTASLTVTHGPPAALSVSTQPPASVVAGQQFSFAVSVVDAFGNLVGDLAPTSVTASASVAPFPTSATTSGGIATFASLVVTQAGGFGVGLSSGSLAQTSTALDVVPATPTAVGFTPAPPGSVTAGASFAVTASVVDAYQNVEAADSSSVIALSAGQGGFQRSATVAAGSATFSGLSLATAGTYGLTASSGALTPANASLTVTAAAPAAIVVTSVLDESTTPRLPHPVVGKPFDTAVQFLDAFGNPASVGPGVTVTLSRTTGTGTLGGTLATAVPAGSSTATIVGSTYSLVENGVGLKVSATGATMTPGNVTVDVAYQSATETGTPGVPLPALNSLNPNGGACTLTTAVPTCSQVTLPAGADGSVFLYQGSCVNVSGIGTVTCKTNGTSTALLVHVDAVLKDANGAPLYSAAHPAQFVVRCLKTLCTHNDNDAYHGYTNNLHELGEDVALNPLQVTVQTPQTVTADATICAQPGVVDAGKFFCIDPALSGRDSQGNYIQVVLFYGDVLGHNH